MNITGGFLNSRKIKVFEQENIKPTLSKVRQGIFNSLSAMIEFNDKKFLDMFSGSGIMAFEAYSRGFKVFAFEKDKLTYCNIKKNAEILGVEGKFLFGDSVKLISKFPETYDIIYLDPPYNSDLYEKALNIIKKENKLAQEGLIVLERKETKNIDLQDFKLLKTKTYGDKKIDFLTSE